jgi:hypothetical protein
MTLLCGVLAGARFVWAPDVSNVSVRVKNDGCSMAVCRYESGFWYRRISCSEVPSVSCGSARQVGGGELLFCGCSRDPAPVIGVPAAFIATTRGCALTQYGGMTPVPCGRGIELMNGDRLGCWCAD